jgi:hypothetical protein
MTTLVLPGGDFDPRFHLSGSLSAWLADDWALLFSHPRDFGHESFECDRWQRIVRDAYRDHGVRPVALARAGNGPERGWIAAVSGDESVLTLSDDPVAMQSLSEVVGSLQGRFVLAVDARLQVHGVLRYLQSCGHAPSPLDLLMPVEKLRCQARSASSWEGPRQDYIPC